MKDSLVFNGWSVQSLGRCCWAWVCPTFCAGSWHDLDRWWLQQTGSQKTGECGLREEVQLRRKCWIELNKLKTHCQRNLAKLSLVCLMLKVEKTHPDVFTLCRVALEEFGQIQRCLISARLFMYHSYEHWAQPFHPQVIYGNLHKTKRIYLEKWTTWPCCECLAFIVTMQPEIY